MILKGSWNGKNYDVRNIVLEVEISLWCII